MSKQPYLNLTDILGNPDPKIMAEGVDGRLKDALKALEYEYKRTKDTISTRTLSRRITI